jgi:shikimate kinase
VQTGNFLKLQQPVSGFSLENSVKRIDDGTRPLLKTGNPLDTAKELFSRRRDLYADACDVLVSSDREPEKITGLINEEIRLSI